jgi:hypothetical protein
MKTFHIGHKLGDQEHDDRADFDDTRRRVDQVDRSTFGTGHDSRIATMQVRLCATQAARIVGRWRVRP